MEFAVALIILTVGWVWSMASKTIAHERALPPGRTEFARRLLKHVVRKPIAELQDGQAAVIRGRVRAIRGVLPIRAPLSGLPVIAVNARMLDDNNVAYVDYYQCCDFELVDDTGAIRIEGRGVDVAIIDVQARYWTPQAIPPPLWNANRPLSATPMIEHVGAQPRWRGTEGVIVDGMEVLVFGMIHTDMTAAANYRGAGTSYVIRATTAFPVALSCDRDVFYPGTKAYSIEELIDLKRGA